MSHAGQLGAAPSLPPLLAAHVPEAADVDAADVDVDVHVLDAGDDSLSADGLQLPSPVPGGGASSWFVPMPDAAKNAADADAEDDDKEDAGAPRRCCEEVEEVRRPKPKALRRPKLLVRLVVLTEEISDMLSSSSSSSFSDASFSSSSW